ncbi:DUF5336 domain-containing protein [Yinghuangia seranimata]|uniref:DUF5336 domain-containing protein n=1 Tax=Yinghuangia seranimata TaxID=408067 RepID=UPI00248B4467|nr:DUF5336 domain-containing protein [Yinghuangia seranimata]MDI2128543.1 DUF5336 domain-containing protein [Yinghuangia seranimata]
MDIKKLTRGDAVIAASALLVLIFSFMDYMGAKSQSYGGETYSGPSVNAWSGDLAPVISAVVLTSIAAAACVVLGRLLPSEPRPLGIPLSQFGVPLAIVAPINALWSLAGKDGLELKVGGIFVLIFVIVGSAAVIATPLVPALKAPLTAGGGAPANAYGQPPAYGQPAPQAAGAPYGGAPAPGGYAAPAAAAAPAADPSFQPYWFSVPDQRQLVDATTNAPTGSLNPGVWYLAVSQHGAGLLVEVDGVRGVLWNLQGVQKAG